MHERKPNSGEVSVAVATEDSLPTGTGPFLCYGTTENEAKGVARYVLTFVDDYSRSVVAFLLTKKSEVSSKFESFKWGQRIKFLRSDNDTKFSNKALEQICQTNDIWHQRLFRTVPSRTAWQNE
ncbi:polyprotein [Phytophthora palmivora]|uniref:Polyprotein n=1 Tax=Phytophthora palmivora TaxID=4796 RepID=A0A2P4X5C8_9STRA|nr:polyprotein [Phytophthora palmivora]